MTPTEKGQGGQGDLAILHPEISATIAGRKVTVREYTFVQGLRLTSLIAPIVDGMAALALAGELPDPEALRPVFGEHVDQVLFLIAESCGQDVAWVAGLPDGEASKLQLMWWTVNAHFFGRRVRQAVIAMELRQSLGEASTSHSPEPGTTTPSTH